MVADVTATSVECLVVVDVQVGFCRSHSTAHIPVAVRDFCARRPFEHCLFTRFVNPVGGPWVNYMGWLAMSEGPETALCPEVAHVATRITSKDTYSALASGGLLEALQKLEPESVAVCGVDTDACVLATCFDLWDHGYRPVVVADLCASGAGEETHLAALGILRRSLGAGQVRRSTDFL